MAYRALALKTLSDIRASYWFIPTCLAVLSVVLAQLTLWVDGNPDWIAAVLPDSMIHTQIDGARATLSVIAQSVIGLAGVMFSITMVAVSFASGNFGPRLIGNFMRDRGNQWSLGILIATFVYALIMLRAVQSKFESEAAFVPQLSLVVAMGLTFLSVMVVIYFVHHVPETINVSNIAARLGRQLCDDLAATARRVAEPANPRVRNDLPRLTLEAVGYVQQMDLDAMNGVAETHGLMIDLLILPGDFVHRDRFVAQVRGGASDDTLDELRQSFALGPSKTEDQNVLFLAEQLVEMIARALSPGVNDPHTAINCLNWLTAALAEAGAAGNVFGVAPREYVSVRALTFRDLLDATFGAAWHYVSDDPLARNAFDECLERLCHGASPAVAGTVDEFRRDLS
ncbi:DUF2254 domain-containing protein [Lutimaribacter marinistellae]|uniref:DUF2254 domain-containing protein n=1 Tax=Lutimaribacter marinistellae TaxID=1820329 RepID=A0ABV7TL36_9RHOB